MNAAWKYGCVAFLCLMAYYTHQQLQYVRIVKYHDEAREVFVYPDQTIEFHGMTRKRIYREHGHVWSQTSVICGRRPPIINPPQEDAEDTALWNSIFAKPHSSTQSP